MSENHTIGGRPIIGYIIVDKVTKNIDWDFELHPLRVDAIQSFSGPHHHWSMSVEGATEDEPYWGSVYEICPVLAPAKASL